jgi:hypothetical protein
MKPATHYIRYGVRSDSDHDLARILAMAIMTLRLALDDGVTFV